MNASNLDTSWFQRSRGKQQQDTSYGKYSLVIVIPDTKPNDSSPDSSPPKTPTPDYDICGDGEGPPNNRKVHFSDDRKIGSTWRDALVCHKEELLSSFCYRQGWALDRSKKNRCLVRRSSSLDRLYSCNRKDRSPLLCDPDPLKAPPLRPESSSSPKPVAPLKQHRSYSVETPFCPPVRCRQRSVSGNVSCKKTPVRSRVDEEALLKRSRLHSSQYELSQDLLDKQVEMLERKYGGLRARQAALTIQRAFRKYTIMRRFQDIASGDRRLSRRLFPSYDIDTKEWVVYNGNGTVSRYHSNNVIYQRELTEDLESSRLARTQSFRERSNCRQLNSAYYDQSTTSDTGVVTSAPSFPRHPAWTAVIPSCRSAPPQKTYLNHSSPVARVQHQKGFRESEESALSMPSLEPEPDPSLQRGSVVRHSISVSPSKSSAVPLALHRTGVRASDVALGRRLEGRKIPPQVPKRTSSMPGCGEEEGSKVAESPVWKRKSLVLSDQQPMSAEDKRLSNISENSEDSVDSGGGYSNTLPAFQHCYPDVRNGATAHVYKVSEIQRKREYRVGLNLFNKKPERGVRYLIQRGFLEGAPQAVARFLLSRKGLSKQMIGEYLGNLQNNFNMAVLECFVQELDLAGMQVDVALRKFQTFFRMPGEAQKIERLVEVFSHRYVACNHDIASKFHSADTVFVLAFAIIMLNTDLHTPNMKQERRMKTEEFIRNLRAIDDGQDLDRDMLLGIYDRIKTNEFKMGSDHVTQVQKVQQTIVGKKPNLALPHRRLVCYCRLYEVYDVSKKERPGVHQREVFLFNDLLMVTKIFSKKKNSVTYTFRQSFPLCGITVTLFEAPYYPHGIRLSQRVDDRVLVTFNARNEHDRSKFVEDLKESVLEMDEMENLRIEGELEKQKMMRMRSENRDSGVCADMDNKVTTQQHPEGNTSQLKRSALSNSLLDLHEQQINKPVRRGSAGSLDSGMSISFQSSAASSVSHDSSSPHIVHASSTSSSQSGSSLGSARGGDKSFLGGWFGKKTHKHSSSSGKT